MDKKNILKFLLIKYRDEHTVDKKIIKELENTIKEIEVAQSMFDTVSDSKLVEVAIYKEDAAKRTYEYLLSLAKEKGINR